MSWERGQKPPTKLTLSMLPSGHHFTGIPRACQARRQTKQDLGWYQLPTVGGESAHAGFVGSASSMQRHGRFASPAESKNKQPAASACRVANTTFFLFFQRRASQSISPVGITSECTAAGGAHRDQLGPPGDLSCLAAAAGKYPRTRR